MHYTFDEIICYTLDMIIFLCALPAEAAPINAYFGLNLLEDCADYRLFGNKNMKLLLTGVGKLCVQKAIDGLGSGICGDVVWLNVGVSGSSCFEHKEMLMIGRVGYNSDFMDINFLDEPKLAITVDEPTQNYFDKCVVDMELWHLKIALGGSSLYSLKIVSDTPEVDFIKNKKYVKDLIRLHLPKIKEICIKIDA